MKIQKSKICWYAEWLILRFSKIIYVCEIGFGDFLKSRLILMKRKKYGNLPWLVQDQPASMWIKIFVVWNSPISGTFYSF